MLGGLKQKKKEKKKTKMKCLQFANNPKSSGRRFSMHINNVDDDDGDGDGDDDDGVLFKRFRQFGA